LLLQTKVNLQKARSSNHWNRNIYRMYFAANI